MWEHVLESNVNEILFIRAFWNRPEKKFENGYFKFYETKYWESSFFWKSFNSENINYF